MEELWREVPGCDGKYQVSNIGRVKSMNFRGNTGQEKVLRLSSDKDGYQKVSIYIDGKQRYFMVHRLVALAFIPNPQKKPEVNHKNGVKSDNCVENLEWCTSSENRIHAYKTGLQPPATQKQIEARLRNIAAASASNIGRKASPESRLKMSLVRKGKPHSKEWVEHWRESMARRKKTVSA